MSPFTGIQIGPRQFELPPKPLEHTKNRARLLPSCPKRSPHNSPHRSTKEISFPLPSTEFILSEAEGPAPSVVEGDPAAVTATAAMHKAPSKPVKHLRNMAVRLDGSRRPGVVPVLGSWELDVGS